MLSPRLLDLLRDYWKTTRPKEWLFPGRRSNEPITTYAVEDACRGARARSGITRPITPHCLRHAFTVCLLEAGTDLRTIQLLLGHNNLATTSRYLRIATSKVCATASPLDALRVMTTNRAGPRACLTAREVSREGLEVADVFRHLSGFPRSTWRVVVRRSAACHDRD